jgi:hypothetical protein
MIRARGKRMSFWNSSAWEWEVEYQPDLIPVEMREVGCRRGPGCGMQVAERPKATPRDHFLG